MGCQMWDPTGGQQCSVHVAECSDSVPVARLRGGGSTLAAAQTDVPDGDDSTSLVDAQDAGGGAQQIDGRDVVVESAFEHVPFDGPECLHKLVEQQAAATPEALAVADERGALAYLSLVSHATRLATSLMEVVAPSIDSLVAIWMERSVGMVVAVLATHHAGCGYVPISVLFPAARREYVVDNSEAVAAIVSESFVMQMTEEDLKRTFLAADTVGCLVDSAPPVTSTDSVGGATSPRLTLPRAVTGAVVAYCCYTSGSTGKPKGICVEHRNAVSVMAWWNGLGKLGQGETLLGVTDLSHDIVLTEMFWPLSCGARLYVASGAAQRDGSQLQEIMSAERVTVMQATPSTYAILEGYGWQGDPSLHVFCGGEAAPMGLAPTFERCKSFTNVYGPTETTIWDTYCAIAADGWSGLTSIPLGLNLWNSATLVLGEAMEILARGEVGMLYIGGAGMTRGYHRLPEKNAAAFVNNPWPDLVELFAGAGFPRPHWLYKTGDLAVRSLDGLLHFRGRADSQVKINGERIELGEVERTIEGHPLVKQCIVLARADMEPQALVLVAYVEMVSEAGSDQAQLTSLLHNFCRESMPAFQAPRKVVFMRAAAWPLNAARKVDRSSLPAPQDKQSTAADSHTSAAEVGRSRLAVRQRQRQDRAELVSRISSAVQNILHEEVDEDSPLLAAGIDSRRMPRFVKVRAAAHTWF